MGVLISESEDVFSALFSEWVNAKSVNGIDITPQKYTPSLDMKNQNKYYLLLLEEFSQISGTL